MKLLLAICVLLVASELGSAQTYIRKHPKASNRKQTVAPSTVAPPSNQEKEDITIIVSKPQDIRYATDYALKLSGAPNGVQAKQGGSNINIISKVNPSPKLISPRSKRDIFIAPRYYTSYSSSCACASSSCQYSRVWYSPEYIRFKFDTQCEAYTGFMVVHKSLTINENVCQTFAPCAYVYRVCNSEYTVCSNGQPKYYSCPIGYVFSIEHNTCRWPSDVYGCSSYFVFSNK
jgi:hypothetical protein